MPATISGVDITQTGTETSLDFLAGFSNVSIFWVAGVECYYIEGTLNIEGSLTFDTFSQHLSVYSAVSTNAINIKSGGSLTLSSYILDRPSYLPAVQAKVLSTSSLHSAIRVRGGGTLDCRGVKIIANGDAAYPMVYELGSTIYLEDAWIVSNKFIRVANQGGGIPSISLKNIISQAGSIAILYAPELFEGLTIYSGNLTFSVGGSEYTIRNFKAINSTTVLNNWNTELLRIKNPVDGTTNRYFTGATAPAGTKFNVVSRETQFKFLDVDGNPTSGYFWIRDVDNGNRVDVPLLAGDQTGDMIYTADSDPLTGLTPLQDVILYIGRNPASGSIPVDDYRTIIPTQGSDLLNIYGGGWGYNLFSVLSQDFKGADALTLEQTLTPDLSITYSTIEEVRALPLIASEFDFYDSVAAWVQDNRNGQTEYMVSRIGGLIDARAYDVSLDPLAASNITFDGTTITAKVNAVSYDIATTGDITATTGVSVEGATLKATNYYITDEPTTLTLDGGVYHITSDIDVSNWTLLNGASFVVDVDNVTITARDFDPNLFDVTGRTGVVIDTDIQVTFTDIDGDPFWLLVYDAANVNVGSDLYYAENLTSHSVTLPSTGDYVIMVDKPAYYSKRQVTTVTGHNQQISVVMKASPDVDATTDVDALFAATSVEVLPDPLGIGRQGILATLNGDFPNVTNAQVIRWFDRFGETKALLELLAVTELSADEVYQTSASGITHIRPVIFIEAVGTSYIRMNTYMDPTPAQDFLDAAVIAGGGYAGMVVYNPTTRNDSNVQIITNAQPNIVDYEVFRSILGDPLQTVDYVAPDNQGIADIATTVSGLLTSAEYVAPDNDTINSIATTVSGLLTSSEYVAPDNATISSIATIVAGLMTSAEYVAPDNATISSIATTVAGLMTSAEYVAPDNATINSIATTVAGLMTSSEYVAPDNATIASILTLVSDKTGYSLTDIDKQNIADRVQTLLGNPLQATDYIAPDNATISSIASIVADKTGYSLTVADKQAIADVVQASILDDGDGQAVLEAIVSAIGNQNIDEVALVAAIRSDLERSGGSLATGLSNMQVINRGVKNASLLIPHNETI